MSERLILHEYAASGNCYKVRLTAALVGVPLLLGTIVIVAGVAAITLAKTKK